MPLPTKDAALALLHQHVRDEYQRHHALMVATAMEGYAQYLFPRQPEGHPALSPSASLQAAPAGATSSALPRWVARAPACCSLEPRRPRRGNSSRRPTKPEQAPGIKPTGNKLSRTGPAQFVPGYFFGTGEGARSGVTSLGLPPSATKSYCTSMETYMASLFAMRWGGNSSANAATRDGRINSG